MKRIFAVMPAVATLAAVALSAGAFAAVSASSSTTSKAPLSVQEQSLQDIEREELQIEQVKQANVDYYKALMQRDTKLYTQRVAADVVFTSTGGVWAISKASELKTLVGEPPRRPNPVKDISLSPINVQVIPQGNTAVVVGRLLGKGVHGGKNIVKHQSFMNIFANLDGRWQLIVSHELPAKN
jgi:ketosteroid isomerase-like protein